SSHQEGQILEGPITNVTDFGIFVGLEGEIDGLVHSSDLSWTEAPEEVLKQHNKGDTIQVKILSIDPEKERISLGIKQLQEEPEGAVNTSSSSSSSSSSASAGASGFKKGDTVTCTVTAIQD